MLCPTFTFLAERCPVGEAYLKTLLAAATRVAHEPGVLRAAQRLVFVLAYEFDLPVLMATELLAAPTPRAMIERARRVSVRLESTLLDRIAMFLPRAVFQGLATSRTVTPARKRDACATAEATTCWNQVEHALRRFLGDET